MQQWEYLFVFAAITSGGGEFRPRFANDQELDDWQKGPTMYDYANQLGERGWELFACHPIVFTQSNWQHSWKPSIFHRTCVPLQWFSDGKKMMRMARFTSLLLPIPANMPA